MEGYTVLVILAIVGVGVQGQRYYLGESGSSDYFTSQDDLPPPQPFFPPSFNPNSYFLPKDLQTSELPSHLQHSLPQYHQPAISRQNFQSNPSPFTLSREYVKPSTHRPDYTKVLAQRYQSEPKIEPNRFNFESLKVNKEGQSKKRESLEDVRGEEEDYVEDSDAEAGNESVSQEKYKNDVDDEEYEYEYEEEPQTDTNLSVTTTQAPSPTVQTKNETFPEFVVSVVTSKTIINNTVISPLPTITTTSESPIVNTTDSWVVIASVQTSRSISGARYIPSSIVDQDERISRLNEHSNEQHEEEETTVEITTTISPSTVKIKTSTESLIDKLDRVQSDLSSGLLTGGFKNDNIAVIEENMSTKMELTTTEKPIASTTKDPYPQVNIRKFNPGSRPSRPKTKDIVAKRKELPSPKPVILDKVKPGEDISAPLPPSDENQNDFTSILRIAKPVMDIGALLPPGYKPPPSTTTTTQKPLKATPKIKVLDDISALLPPGYKPIPDLSNEHKSKDILTKAKPVEDIGDLLPPGYKPKDVLTKAKPLDDISALLPPGYKPAASDKPKDILSKAKPVKDISALLPPGYKPPVSDKSKDILSKAKPVDITALLPPGYKPPASDMPKDILSKVKPVEDISALLPPGYKPAASDESKDILSKAKPVEDISALLPPGYKPRKYGAEKSTESILSKAKPIDDISALLPPGYKKGFSKPASKATTASSVRIESVSQSIPSKLVPPGFKLDGDNSMESATVAESTSESSSSTTSSFKVVFPSRPGGGARKTPRLTTPKSTNNEEVNKPTIPTIQKGWPVRASTEFTGWPTPSTTPISIEKLLEAARMLSTSTSTETSPETTATTTTTTTTTTTPRPTTPGICTDNCEIAGTIKLVGGAKWVPELLDPNTKEYQILANSVQSELENIYNSSPTLTNWYRKIRIDGFSEGSILVDYLVEFNEIGQKVDTQEIKRLFHQSLTENLNGKNREAKVLNGTRAERLTLGQFELDPKFTDFIVIPRNSYPTVGYAEDVLLPQWAIAVIVIGLASLLFVIIFGVTVFVNRHKNSKKSPVPLTEDMLNELNKNHMGGLENYGADDFYNMEDVWSDNHYEQKPQKKRHTNSSLYDNSTTHLYDSWRSQWNGQPWNAYNNGHYGYSGSHHSGYNRRADYDTNF